VTNDIELKPCPFCAGKAEFLPVYNGNNKNFYISCMNTKCLIVPNSLRIASNNRDGIAALIQAWNTREGESE